MAVRRSALAAKPVRALMLLAVMALSSSAACVVGGFGPKEFGPLQGFWAGSAGSFNPLNFSVNHDLDSQPQDGRWSGQLCVGPEALECSHADGPMTDMVFSGDRFTASLRVILTEPPIATLDVTLKSPKTLAGTLTEAGTAYPITLGLTCCRD